MPRHPGRSGRVWNRVRTAVLTDWRNIHGDLCPGYQRAAHQATPTNPLTVDHSTALINGGDPHDRANLAVLCHSCNSAKRDRPMTDMRPTPSRTW